MKYPHGNCWGGKPVTNKRAPVMQEMCKTCPWREGSPYEYLRATLEQSALGQASRICHSTGDQDVIPVKSTGPERLCRGARNVQLEFFRAIGFLRAATDEAWEEKCKEMNL
jgi:hypothetical protein